MTVTDITFCYIICNIISVSYNGKRKYVCLLAYQNKHTKLNLMEIKLCVLIVMVS